MTNADDLTCQELVELVTEYLERALVLAQQARFEGHLAQCRSCRTYLEQMRQTIRLLALLADEPPKLLRSRA
jgi:predicted anti-sigma-YlaC factor YlaD